MQYNTPVLNCIHSIYHMLNDDCGLAGEYFAASTATKLFFCHRLPQLNLAQIPGSRVKRRKQSHKSVSGRQKTLSANLKPALVLMTKILKRTKARTAKSL